MNRNHPYFDKKNALVESNSPVQENFGTLPFPVSPANSFAPIPICNYEPVVVHPNSPSWNENHDILPFMDAVFKKLNCYSHEMGGYHIDGQGLVYPISITEEANNGIISAIAYAIDNDPDESMVMSAAATIVNTEDAGLRYVCCTEDGKIHDIGPVNHACIIGNLKRPEGLYIPLSNTKAMADGAIILDEMIAMATRDDRDLYDYEDFSDEYNASNSNDIVPVYKDDHKCSCNGKCGKNCKCKSDKK